MPTNLSSGFRIESQFELTSDWVPNSEFTKIYHNRSSAIATALEGVDDPKEQEVRLVDIATNQVIWRSVDEEYE